MALVLDLSQLPYYTLVTVLKLYKHDFIKNKPTNKQMMPQTCLQRANNLPERRVFHQLPIKQRGRISELWQQILKRAINPVRGFGRDSQKRQLPWRILISKVYSMLGWRMRGSKDPQMMVIIFLIHRLLKAPVSVGKPHCRCLLWNWRFQDFCNYWCGWTDFPMFMVCSSVYILYIWSWI